MLHTVDLADIGVCDDLRGRTLGVNARIIDKQEAVAVLGGQIEVVEGKPVP
jgi:hypothetical protein